MVSKDMLMIITIIIVIVLVLFFTYYALFVGKNCALLGLPADCNRPFWV